jgi:cell division protease FtsH
MPLENAQTIMLTVESKGGTTSIGIRSGITIWTVLLNLVPMILVLVILFIIFRNANNQNSKAFDFAKNRARLNREKSVTFKDVAGVDEEKQELEELIDFLKNPKKYVDMGARIPKGVLLVGSPGTGKTLLARAVAGEANVPFFSISGSDFVEMFVGVGASRVRDLFKVAKENSPCIIFIDEIDAVGRQRGAGLGGGHDEREQTLNQLLVEMDGFTTNMGIIIIAATNRPDVLDPALLRPGRFDRQITISLPDVRGREAILKVHARNKKLDPKVKLSEFAGRIPGFSGADIENLLNEAALLAARDNRTLISQLDMDEAIDRVMMGPAKKSRKYSPDEKKTVAYHEAGHAVIGIKLPDANVVQKVTIIPRGRAGGYNLMTPLEEKFLATKSSLLAQITSYLGGRVAEEIVFDTVTTGAYNDFQMATAIARAMVTEYGMSDLGPVQYESAGGNVFLGRDYFKEKNFSDQVAHEIDKEVRHIITTCFDKAKTIITEHRSLLDLIAHYLVEVETLTKADIDEIVQTGKLSWYQEKTLDGNAA